VYVLSTFCIELMYNIMLTTVIIFCCFVLYYKSNPKFI